MIALQTLKKLAGKVGNLREVVGLFDELWRRDTLAFERLLVESAPEWKDYEYIPLALGILTTETDDANLRQLVCAAAESARVDPSERESIYLTAAHWGDAWAKGKLSESLTLSIKKALRSDIGDILWSLQRCALTGHWPPREDLDSLTRSLKEGGLYKPEYAGMLEALLQRDEEGFDGLARRLEECFTRRNILDVHVAACFLLGTRGVSRYAPLFLKLLRELHRTDCRTDGVRKWAIISFAYSARSFARCNRGLADPGAEEPNKAVLDRGLEHASLPLHLRYPVERSRAFKARHSYGAARCCFRSP